MKKGVLLSACLMAACQADDVDQSTGRSSGGDRVFETASCDTLWTSGAEADSTFALLWSPRSAPGGGLYVADIGNAKLHYVNAAGELVWSYGRRGQGPGELLSQIEPPWEGWADKPFLELVGQAISVRGTDRWVYSFEKAGEWIAFDRGEIEKRHPHIEHLAFAEVVVTKTQYGGSMVSFGDNAIVSHRNRIAVQRMRDSGEGQAGVR